MQWIHYTHTIWNNGLHLFLKMTFINHGTTFMTEVSWKFSEFNAFNVNRIATCSAQWPYRNIRLKLKYIPYYDTHIFTIQWLVYMLINDLTIILAQLNGINTEILIISCTWQHGSTFGQNFCISLYISIMDYVVCRWYILFQNTVTIFSKSREIKYLQFLKNAKINIHKILI